MSDRKLMQMVLNALESFESGTNGLYKGEFAEEIKALRDRLAQPEYDQTALELCDVCGWKTVVPEEGCLNCKRLAQPDTTQVTTEVTGEVPCKTHPDAPHGFDRNASLSENRYVCECENWEPPPDHLRDATKKVWVGLTDEDLRKFAEMTPSWEELCAAVESKLKEKNFTETNENRKQMESL
jgi:hypothetical protein